MHVSHVNGVGPSHFLVFAICLLFNNLTYKLAHVTLSWLFLYNHHLAFWCSVVYIYYSIVLLRYYRTKMDDLNGNHSKMFLNANVTISSKKDQDEEELVDSTLVPLVGKRLIYMYENGWEYEVYYKNKSTIDYRVLLWLWPDAMWKDRAFTCGAYRHHPQCSWSPGRSPLAHVSPKSWTCIGEPWKLWFSSHVGWPKNLPK